MIPLPSTRYFEAAARASAMITALASGNALGKALGETLALTMGYHGPGPDPVFDLGLGLVLTLASVLSFHKNKVNVKIRGTETPKA